MKKTHTKQFFIRSGVPDGFTRDQMLPSLDDDTAKVCTISVAHFAELPV